MRRIERDKARLRESLRVIANEIAEGRPDRAPPEQFERIVRAAGGQEGEVPLARAVGLVEDGLGERRARDDPGGVLVDVEAVVEVGDGRPLDRVLVGDAHHATEGAAGRQLELQPEGGALGRARREVAEEVETDLADGHHPGPGSQAADVVDGAGRIRQRLDGPQPWRSKAFTDGL